MGRIVAKWDKLLNIIDFRNIYQILNFLSYRFHSMFNFFHKEKVFFYPPHITFFPSYLCNLSCRMCLTHSKIIPDSEYKYKGASMLSYKAFVDAITRFKSSWVVAFIGNGEPLLNKDIFRMINYAFYKMRMPVSIVSNGTLIDRFIMEIVNSPLYEISISVNAHNEEEYYRLTHNPKFFHRKITDNIRNLIIAKKEIKNPIRIVISIIVDKENYKKIPEMIRYAEELGADQLSLYNIMPWFIGGLLPEERALFAEREVLEFLGKIKPSRKIDILLPALLESGKTNHICRDAYHSMSIDGNGDISGCERMLLNSEGNGKYYDKNVFNNLHFRQLRRKFIFSDSILLRPCEFCYDNTNFPAIILKRYGC